jgi:hypothetical protein
MTQGASATARNMTIVLSGTGGANLIVPTNKKLYFISNGASGSVTVKTSAGTGIAVPAASKIVLVCDSTNVVVATNYMVSPTLLNAALTGTPTAPTAAVGTSTTQIATTAFVNAAIVAAYPVGSIYMSTVSTNPNTLFGFGTWVAYGQGRMPISADATYTAGSTGGSATTTLITANLPSHSHSNTVAISDPGHFHSMGRVIGSNGNLQFNSGEGVADTYPNTGTSTTGISATVTIGNTGSGTAATTISPYIAVYMWNRTV